MFYKFDGTSRQPRQVQSDAFNWLRTNWHKSDIFAMVLPTGVGKSAVLRSIQIEFKGAVGIVPSNILLDQYIETYPKLNYLKGMDHYTCGDAGLTCQERAELNMGHAADCPYNLAKDRAKQGEETIFNPISRYYFKKSVESEVPKVIVVDESHKLVDMMMLLVSYSFSYKKYEYPTIKSDIELVTWLNDLKSKLHLESKEEGIPKKKKNQVLKQLARINFLHKAFTEKPQDFVFYTDIMVVRGRREEYLHIKPVEPPLWLLKNILEADKLILLSATMLESDLWDMGLKDYLYKTFPSPIEKHRRQIVYSPAGVPMSFGTNPKIIADWIQTQLNEYPGKNTIVHLSYGWVEKIKPFFPDALTHTFDTKTDALERFKKDGGLWLAAGCAEGIDLPGDECRLNLIPMIMYANIKDPVTVKQLARPRGQLKYKLEAIKLMIQQAGRSTRGLDDHSITVIGDNRFPSLFFSTKQYVPASFSEAIVWRKQDVCKEF